MWENAQRFRLNNVVWERGWEEAMTHRWRVSYAQDLLLVQAIYGALYPQNPHFTLQDILDLLQREPRLAAVNAAYARLNGNDRRGRKPETVTATDRRVLQVGPV